jgi:hypothetical protein
MADPKIEDRSDEMEEDLHKLEDHIDDAGKKLQARKEDADVVDDVTGDWEGEQDRGNGDDPSGARADAHEGAPGGSQDGPGAPGAGGDSDEKSDADDLDELVEEEAASPT